MPGELKTETISHAVEAFCVGSLEAVDRLLFVADDEERPWMVRGIAGGQFLGQGTDDVPLGVTGVLSLVDKNMLDPAVETILAGMGVI